MKNEQYKIDLGDTRFTIRTHVASVARHYTANNESTHNAFTHIHVHNSYEMFCILDGEITVNTEKETYVCRNSLVIIPPDISHYVVFNDATAFIFNFTAGARDKSLQEANDRIVDSFPRDIAVFEIGSDERFYVQKLVSLEGNRLFPEVEKNLLTLLMSEVLSHLIADEKANVATVKNQYVTVIESYIVQHSSEKIQLDDLGAELHLCAKQVARIIKKEWNCTLYDLVTKQRINVAAVLLKNTSMKGYEISSSVGYESPKDFRRNFKKIYGVSPTEYRREAVKSP